MSDSAPERPSSYHPTRQQIDELEALMQRMLALPVQPVEADVLAEPAPFPEPLPLPEPAVVVTSTQFTARAPEPAIPSASPQPAAFTAVEPSAGPLLKVMPEETSVRESATDRPQTASTSRLPRVRSQRSSTGAWVRPLLWSNRLFDRCTVPLGDTGRWLRGPRGRACLGYTGLAFLATALAWGMLDWMGWL